MIRIIKAEWRKLRRPTLLLGTLGAVVFFSGLVSSLLFLLLDSPQGNGDRGVVITREMLSPNRSNTGVLKCGRPTRNYRSLRFCRPDCSGVHLRNSQKHLGAPTRQSTSIGWQVRCYEVVCNLDGRH